MRLCLREKGIRRMIITAMQLHEGERLPHCYGIAWALPQELAYICLPIPFNVIARGFRDFWLRLQFPQGADVLTKCWQDGQTLGLAQGYRQGRESGLRSQLLIDEIRREIAELRAMPWDAE